MKQRLLGPRIWDQKKPANETKKFLHFLQPEMVCCIYSHLCSRVLLLLPWTQRWNSEAGATGHLADEERWGKLFTQTNSLQWIRVAHKHNLSPHLYTVHRGEPGGRRRKRKVGETEGGKLSPYPSGNVRLQLRRETVRLRVVAGRNNYKMQYVWKRERRWTRGEDTQRAGGIKCRKWVWAGGYRQVVVGSGTRRQWKELHE